MQRKPASRTGGITLRHRYDQVGSPCMKTTGCALALVEVREAQAVDLAVVRARRGSRAAPRAPPRACARVGHRGAGAYPAPPSARLAPDARCALQLAPILAAEKSKTPFYIAGGALVAVGAGRVARRSACAGPISRRNLGGRASRHRDHRRARAGRALRPRSSPPAARPARAERGHGRRTHLGAGRHLLGTGTPRASGTAHASSAATTAPTTTRHAERRRARPRRARATTLALAANPGGQLSFDTKSAQRQGGHGNDRADQRLTARTQRHDRPGQQGAGRDADLRRRLAHASR